MGQIFWMLMILWFVFGIGSVITWNGPYARWATTGFGVLLFVLLALLGWHSFGSVIK